MYIKYYLIKLLGGYTQKEFDKEIQDLTKDLTKDLTQRNEYIRNLVSSIKSYSENSSRNNIIAIEQIHKLLRILKVELENNAVLKNKDLILDTYLEIKDLILNNNDLIICMCKDEIDVTKTNYISQIFTDSKSNPTYDFTERMIKTPRFLEKDAQYKIKILSQNIEVIATVETDIYFDSSIGFCFKYTDLETGRKFISPYNVKIISRYLELKKSQLI